MHSDLIGKIEKARRYAEEPERITITDLSATFHGGNGDHHITLQEDGHWNCTCSFFHSWKTCAHVMAMQKLLDAMLPHSAREAELSIDYTHSNGNAESVAV